MRHWKKAHTEGTKTEEERRTVMSQAAKSREEELVWGLTVDGPFCQLSAAWCSPQSDCFGITLPPPFTSVGSTGCVPYCSWLVPREGTVI